MTKRDYELTASAFSDEREDLRHHSISSPVRVVGYQTLDLLAARLSAKLAWENPAFSQSRFLAACKGDRA